MLFVSKVRVIYNKYAFFTKSHTLKRNYGKICSPHILQKQFGSLMQILLHEDMIKITYIYLKQQFNKVTEKAVFESSTLFDKTEGRQWFSKQPLKLFMKQKKSNYIPEKIFVKILLQTKII